jgi:hypothetical protein
MSKVKITEVDTLISTGTVHNLKIKTDNALFPISFEFSIHPDHVWVSVWDRTDGGSNFVTGFFDTADITPMLAKALAHMLPTDPETDHLPTAQDEEEYMQMIML